MTPSRRLIIACSVALFLAHAAVASAQVEQFLGKWVNVDPESRGVLTLDIHMSGETVMVEGTGRCHPIPCRIPPREATGFIGPDGSADSLAMIVGPPPSPSTKSIRTIQVLQLDKADGARPLRLEVFTRYDDESGRPPKHFIFFFTRQGATAKR